MLDTRCSCELVTNVVYKAIQCSSIHNCSFMQQTSSHNNISVLGVQTYLICYLFVALFSTHLLVNCLCLACCLCLFMSLFTIYIHKMSHCHCLVFYEQEETIAIYLRLTIFGSYYWSKASWSEGSWSEGSWSEELASFFSFTLWYQNKLHNLCFLRLKCGGY